MAGTATAFLRIKNAKSIAIAPRAEGEAEKVAQTAMAGAIMGLFEPDKYRTSGKEERQLDRIVVVIESGDKKAVQQGAERGRIIGEAANFTPRPRQRTGRTSDSVNSGPARAEGS